MIGKIERVPLREVWKNEAKDFTGWLFDNLEVLGEELELDLTANEKEKRTGSFSADIVAEDAAGRRVIIENQLEKTDHDHLGKILTYVSNLDASIAVWVSSNPRPEHQRAMEWLNETGTGVNFYMVKVEAYRIGESEPAAKFSVVTGPSEKSVIVGGEKKERTEHHKLRMAFWRSLLEKSEQKTDIHENTTPGIASWIYAESGVKGLRYNYVVTKKSGQAELFVDRGKGGARHKEESKHIYDELHSYRSEVEKDFGGKLRWERLDDRNGCRISKRFDYAGIDDTEQWGKLQDDMIDAMIRLEKALRKRIKGLKL